MNFIKTFSPVLVLLFVSFAYAEDRTVYFILDSSGSMWGRVEGRMKIDVARSVMKQVLSGIPSDVAVGLSAYGHRKKADCSDIEELASVRAGGAAFIAGKVDSLRPNGKTPLSEAIVKAAESVQSLPGEKTIVLISDGIETCDKDPCAVVRQLKESGARFVLHVVGFDVKESASSQLSCMAEAGGGRYFPAKNAEGLTKTLEAVRESVVEKKPLQTAVATLAPLQEQLSKGSTSVRVKVQGPGGIILKLPSWLKAPYYWKIIDPETGEEEGRFTSVERVSAGAGVYQIAWRQSEHGSRELILGEVFSVEPGKDTEVQLASGAHLTPAGWIPSNPCFWELRAGQDSFRFRGSFDPQLVSPGKYDVNVRLREHSTSDSHLGIMEVRDGQVTEFPLNTGVQFNVPQEKKPPYRVRFFPIDDPSRPAVTLSGEWLPVPLHPGRYRVTYQETEHGSSEVTIIEDLAVEEGVLSEIDL